MRANRRARQGATPRPGLRRLTATRQPRSDAERIAEVAASADLPVEDVLRQVAGFRLALETDMIIAAAAVDADRPEVLSEVLDDERLELATFHDRLLTRLADAAADDEIALRRQRSQRRVVPRLVASAAAVLAIVAAARIVAPGTPETSNVAALEAANEHYADFSSAVTSDSPIAVREAAAQLHETLSRLIEDHAGDPEIAAKAAQMLQAEISLLRANDPIGASQVLAQARTLVTLLERKAPPGVRDSVKPVLDAAVSERPTQKRPSPSSTKPTSSPKSTSSPSASGSSSPDSSGGPLDTP